jgi:NAD(P)-dependent dehydrogenase (short-subunit alcohol dehydrogenase family)
MKVNLDGVVNGVLAFVPRMAAQAGEKHVVNTASTAALEGYPSLGHYSASKHAVLGLSETLALEGAAYGLGCTVLCPGATNTGIVKSARNRQDAFGGRDDAFNPLVQAAISAGQDPEETGRIVRDAVQSGDLYVFTHPESRAHIEKRYHAMMAAQAKAEARLAHVEGRAEEAARPGDPGPGGPPP